MEEARLVSIDLYNVGFVHISVCASEDTSVEEILRVANQAHPTGLGHGWMLDDSPTFAGGQPNPCPCDQRRGHVHRLLVC